MFPKFLQFPFRLLLSCALVMALTSCQTEEQKKKALTAKLREKMSIPDQSLDTNFMAFISRLRQAVAARDMPTIASMMTPNFGYRLDPPGEGDGVFAYWDKNKVWPELNLVLRERFVPLDSYMVAPAEFANSAKTNTGTYRGYRAGITLVEGGWRFAYFVNN